MGIEIERKFLIDIEAFKKANTGPEVALETEIKQGYLSSNPERTVRVRIEELSEDKSNAWITVKSKSVGATRGEWDYQIPTNEAEELILLCEQPIIHKTRYCFWAYGTLFEVDIFHGANEGLAIAEIELESEDDAYAIPNWLGEEVTYDPRYFNSSLIANPFTQW